MPDPNRFHYQAPHDSANELTIVPLSEEPELSRLRYQNEKTYAGGIVISVSDEKAVDSYNDTFECDIHLDRDTAILLRDWLNKRYP